MPHSHPLPKNKKRWEWGWDRGGGQRSLWVGTGWLMLIFSVTCFPIVFDEGVRILGLEVVLFLNCNRNVCTYSAGAKNL